MLYELIMPIGTSLLTGWLPRVERDIALPVEWVGSHPNGRAGAAAPDRRLWIPRLKAALRNGERTSAELDSTRLWYRSQPDRQVSRIHLLVSDTAAAIWVAEVLAAILPALFTTPVEVLSRPIPRLSSHDMREGLVEFIRAAALAIKEAKERGAQPVVNATPGFKAETSLLTLLGAVLGAETVYLHEQMQDVIVVPALPLRWGLEESEVQAIMLIGEAAPRDVVRDLRLGSRPRLWPFLDRLGSGNEEIWARSALGQMVVESAGDSTIEEPPQWSDECKYERAAKEGGHEPADTAQIATGIGNSLGFVKKVELSGWGAMCSPGILLPKRDDARLGFVRLRVPSLRGDDKHRMLWLCLHTTAENDSQWHTARLRAAERCGRVSLVEELSEPGPTASASDLQDTFAAMSGLRAEEVLEKALQEAHGQLSEAQLLAEKMVGERDRATSRAAVLEGSLDRAKKQSAERQRSIDELRKRLEACEGDVQSARKQIENLQQELDGLRLAATIPEHPMPE